MNNPGTYNLGDSAIGAAVTGSILTRGVSPGGVAQEHIDAEGATSATISADFSYGAGGTTTKIDIYTSLNQGNTWVHIARFAFTTAADFKVVNLSALTPVTTPASATAVLSDNTCLDGVFGDRFRATMTTTGTYTGNTQISVRATFR